MKIIDLSQKMERDMSYFPGTKEVMVEQVSQIKEDGFRLTDFHSTVHSGTHCDSSGHYLEDGLLIDEMPLDYYVGEALIVDVSVDGGRELGADVLDGVEVEKGDILILRSGFSKYWKTDKYVEDYPYLSKELAEKIVELGVKSLGIDFLSPDAVDKDHVHKVLLGSEIPIVENLANLDEIKVDRFFFSAAPINIKGAEGSFTRAYGIVE